MFPKVLTEFLCSLTTLCDHVAFSVIWEMTPKAEIISIDFFKSLIRSKASLSYEQAQKRINDKEDISEISLSLRNLLEISKILKEGRKKNGSLSLAST